MIRRNDKRTVIHGGGVPLREYVDGRLESFADAVKIAHAGMEKRLDAMNEVRRQLETTEQKFVTRPEHERLNKDINSLQQFKAESASLFGTRSERERIDNDIRSLQQSKAALEGKASQSSLTIVLLLATVSIVISVIQALAMFISHK